MSKLGLRVCTVFLVVTMLLITACGNQQNTTVNDVTSNSSTPHNMKKLQAPNTLDTSLQNNAVITLLEQNGKKYVPLHEIVDVLEFHDDWDEEAQMHYIGDNDVVYAIKIDSTEAEKEDEPLNLNDVPIVKNGMTFITKETFEQMFGEDANYKFQDKQLVVYPHEANDTNEDLDFADDPEDPDTLDEEVWHAYPVEDDSIEVLKKVDRSGIISTARRYLGVKYKFGAKPYAVSKRFDCSSYTQHVFEKYGVTLNRVARSQAKQGTSVSRKSLRKGDLMFFYIPGRFKSNKTIGHVGIYMGNNRMIHAGISPKNGVQITNINSSYWKKTFIRARRVVA